MKKSIAGISFYFEETDTAIQDTNDFQCYLHRLSSGDIVNQSEQRAATHLAFREKNPSEIVQKSLQQVKLLSEKIRHHDYAFEVTDVVNIGIGGSDLGPKLMCEVFSDKINQPRIHFISNLDAVQINLLLKKLSPEKTIFILTSKSFSTLEMLENKKIAERWLSDHKVDSPGHFVAITNNVAAALKNNIPESLILSIPDSIGGRFSVWSAVGLSCAIALGFDAFYKMHEGAYEMDQHFLHAKINENYPVIYASMLYTAIIKKNLKTVAILPYAQCLRILPDYLQQLFMESLGKSVNTHGESISYPTGPILFGSTGTSSQHSFQQLMMQGTHPIFADFILPLHQDNSDEAKQVKMISNCLTQIKTLRFGSEHDELLKRIPGGKCANLLVLEKLDIQTMGALIAFYEHAVVTLAYMLKINPFDQWGVEYAKRESEKLSREFNGRIPSLGEIEKIVSGQQ